MASLKDFANRFLGKDDIDAPNQWGHENPQQSVDINQLAALIPGLKGGMDRTNAPAPVVPPESEMSGGPGPLMGEADYDEATGYVPPDLGEEPIDNRSMVSKSTDDAFTQWLMGQDKQPSLTNVDDMGTDRTKAAPKMYFEPMDVEGHIPAEAGTINPAARAAKEGVAPAGKTIDIPSSLNTLPGLSKATDEAFDQWLLNQDKQEPIMDINSPSIANIYDWLNRTQGNEAAEKWYAPVRKVDKQVADEQRAVADRLYRQTPSGVRISQLNDDLARIVLGGMPGSDAAAPAHLQQNERSLEAQQKRALLEQQIQERHRKEDKDFQMTNRNMDRQIAQDARNFQQFESLTDNQRALQFQKSQNAQKRAEIAAQNTALVKDLIGRGYYASTAQEIANGISATAYDSLNKTDLAIDEQMKINSARIEDFKSRSNSMGNIPVTVPQAPVKGGDIHTGRTTSTFSNEQERMSELPLQGKTLHLKPELVGDKKKYAETANALNNATESLNEFQSDVNKFFDDLDKGNLTTAQISEKIGELSSQIPNVSGKLLNAEGLGSTVSSLKSTEEALGTSMKELTAAAIGSKVPIAGSAALNIYRGKVNGSINGYRRAIGGGLSNFADQYTTEGRNGLIGGENESTKKGSVNKPISPTPKTVTMTRNGETIQVPPNKVAIKQKLGWVRK